MVYMSTASVMEWGPPEVSFEHTYLACVRWALAKADVGLQTPYPDCVRCVLAVAESTCEISYPACVR